MRPSAALLLLPLAVLAGPGAAAEPAPGWPAVPAPLTALAAGAETSNLALAGDALEVERASARLAEARSHFLPSVGLAARYSVADGGRTIDLPLGDLLNGAYSTLNQYLASQGQAARFPTLGNESIRFLRAHEQETKLTVTQPLYAPEISRSTDAARAGLAARQAAHLAYRRQLRAEVQTAALNYLAAEDAIGIYDSALGLVTESLRVNRSLVANGRATEDAVLRAEAEVAAVTQQRQDAVKDRDLARCYVNFLRNQPFTDPVATLTPEEAATWAQALVGAPIPGQDSSGREELVAASRAEAAARKSTEALRARQHPTLALAVEGGIQGETYRTGPGSNYALGSVVMDWNLFDGNQRRSQIAQAKLEERQAARQREETGLQLGLQLQQARAEFSVAQTSLGAAQLRREAARAGYRFVARREAEGMVNQITVLDARNTLTAAELNFTITRTRLLIAAVKLDLAAALTPLP